MNKTVVSPFAIIWFCDATNVSHILPDYSNEVQMGLYIHGNAGIAFVQHKKKARLKLTYQTERLPFCPGASRKGFHYDRKLKPSLCLQTEILRLWNIHASLFSSVQYAASG